MSRFCLLLAVTFTIVATGMGVRVKRVVGGSHITQGRYPFLVSLWYMGENNYFTANTPHLNHTCGGSLIADRWILTSAVCFDDSFLPGVGDPKNWEVYLGMNSQTDAREESQRVDIEKIFYSPNYNLTESYGDIALLKIDQKADLQNPSIGLVAFNHHRYILETGLKCIVMGWGMIAEEPFGYGSDFPNEAQVPIFDLEKCKEIYSQENITAQMGPLRIDEGMVCAGKPEGGVDACSGDSGSPLVCYFADEDGGQEGPVVVATVTTGYGCARENFPGIYTSTCENSDWIEETLKKNSD